MKNFFSLDDSILPGDAAKYFSDLCHEIVEKKLSLLGQQGGLVEVFNVKSYILLIYYLYLKYVYMLS